MLQGENPGMKNVLGYIRDGGGASEGEPLRHGQTCRGVPTALCGCQITLDKYLCST